MGLGDDFGQGSKRGDNEISDVVRTTRLPQLNARQDYRPL